MLAPQMLPPATQSLPMITNLNSVSLYFVIPLSCSLAVQYGRHSHCLVIGVRQTRFLVPQIHVDQQGLASGAQTNTPVHTTSAG